MSSRDSRRLTPRWSDSSAVIGMGIEDYCAHGHLLRWGEAEHVVTALLAPEAERYGRTITK
jgi:hypothetical protein